MLEHLGDFRKLPDLIADQGSLYALLESIRWPRGFSCTECQNSHFTLSTLKSGLRHYRCKRCGHRTSLIAGTKLEGSRFQLQEWVHLAYLFASSEEGLSTETILKETGIVDPRSALHVIDRLQRSIHEMMSPSICGWVEMGQLSLDLGTFPGATLGHVLILGVSQIQEEEKQGLPPAPFPIRLRFEMPSARSAPLPSSHAIQISHDFLRHPILDPNPTSNSKPKGALKNSRLKPILSEIQACAIRGELPTNARSLELYLEDTAFRAGCHHEARNILLSLVQALFST